MSQYVYALLAEPPRGDAGAGLGAESLRFVPVGGVVAVVSELPAPPPVSPTTLRAHDAVVRRLAAEVDAILPVRFGTMLDGERELTEALAGRVSRLREALALVAGREQMTLRIFGEASPAEVTGPTPIDLGPGARYLHARRSRTARDSDVPELAPLRARLAPLIRAEQTERHETAPLLASVYHLVDRGRAPAYLEAISAGASALAPNRVSASGPWPPYAFAPERLG